MKKIFLLFVFSAILGVLQLVGQVPYEMTYQMMVIDPQSGHIEANKDVAVRMEVRKGEAKGEVVWAQDFDVHTDKSGQCSLVLKLSENIDWGDGEYFLATKVDGQEGGVAKLTSVPYALRAAKAESIEGALTAESLVGTWDDEDMGMLYVFNADGTGTRNYYYGAGNTKSLKWMISPFGYLYLTMKDDYNKDSIKCLSTFKTDEDSILVGSGDRATLWIRK